MTVILPSYTSMEDVGSVFLKEFTFIDGCEKTRTHPLVILEKPKRVTIPNFDCVTPQLNYTEWSCSVQFFRNELGQRGCLDHTISIRLSLSSDTDVDTVISNVSSLLSQFSSAPMPYTISS